MAEPAYPLPLPEDDAQAWPAQGSWTYEDYLRLPDDGRRYEVIRGFLYVSPALSYSHQYCVTKLGWRLSAYRDAAASLRAGWSIRSHGPSRVYVLDPKRPEYLLRER